jgi:hypothetical protein
MKAGPLVLAAQNVRHARGHTMVTELSRLEFLMLRDLTQQSLPVWGGHLERGEPITSPTMERWVRAGLITLTKALLPQPTTD